MNDGYTSLETKELGVTMDGKGLSPRHVLTLTLGKLQMSTSGAELGFKLLRACAVLRPGLTTRILVSHSKEIVVGAAKIFHTAVASIHRLGHELRDVPSQRQE